MKDQVIKSLHLSKLGHDIEEIRVRALNNIICKLDHGLIKENDLMSCKELFQKLLDWFKFEPCPEKEKVLRLILKILKVAAHSTIFSELQPSIISGRLNELKTQFEPSLNVLVDQIIELVENQVKSEDSEPTISVGETFTPHELHIELPSSADQQQEPEFQSHSRTNGCNSSQILSTSADSLHNSFPHILLPWQPLVPTDRHVLAAVEDHLGKIDDIDLTVHTCNFFVDVMLQDFPAEIFIQRPTIVKLLFDLLDNNSAGSNQKLCFSVLKCLHKLCKLLRCRVNYYSDPCVANLKHEDAVRNETPSFISAGSLRTLDSGDYLQQYSAPHSGFNNVEAKNNVKMPVITGSDSEDSVLLQLHQISLPHFCLLALHRALTHLVVQTGEIFNTTMALVMELIKLIEICITPRVWKCLDPVAVEITDNLRMVLSLFADVIENLRRLVFTSKQASCGYLQLLALIHHLLIFIFTEENLNEIPNSLKKQLIACLFSFPFLQLYPELHENILRFAKLFSGFEESMQLFYDTHTIAESMASAVKFIKGINMPEDVSVLPIVQEAFISLEFHKSLLFISRYLDFCVNNIPRLPLKEGDLQVLNDITTKLLAHNDDDIKLEMYRCCHNHIMLFLGVEQTKKMSSNDLLFFFNTKVLTEVICHGLSSTMEKVKQYASEMIVHVLKGKLMMPVAVWQNFLTFLIPVLPLLQCYANKNTSLGRAIIGIFDTDISDSIYMPRIEILKGNIRLMFCIDELTRDQAVPRLTWLLAKEDFSYEKLPDLASLHDVQLNKACLVTHPIDVTKPRDLQNYFQVGSMCQVIEMLTAERIEPRVRHSALIQLSVMLEDLQLHSAFLEQKGLDIVLKIFSKSLIEKEFNYYPDSCVPIVSILKNVCHHNASVRQVLAEKDDLYYSILRTLFLFSRDDHLRLDTAQLLCLLLFNPYILSLKKSNLTNQKWNQISLPELVVKNLQLPFICHSHWKVSPHTVQSLRVIMSKEECQTFLSYRWNSEMIGGVDHLVEMKLENENPLPFSQDLLLFDDDLEFLKELTIKNSCLQLLYDIQNATTHNAVEIALGGLTRYLTLHLILSGIPQCDLNSFALSQRAWQDLPWEESLIRFLGASPGCVQDEKLLIMVLKFLNFCIRLPINKGTIKKGTWKWISDILKDEKQPILELLRIDGEISSMEICQEVLSLCQECCNIEHDATGTWIGIIHVLAKNLQFNDSQHFYNLAVLDWILSCLAHLTGKLGWSKQSGNIPALFQSLISTLTELVIAFHCCKGENGGTSLASFMGLSITRSATLCLNHILCEMQSENKEWETLWVKAYNEEIDLSWVQALWLSRDTIVRAGALQLIAGFCSTQEGCVLLKNGLHSNDPGIWNIALSFLLDHAEASIVREQAAAILTNLTSYSNSDEAISFIIPLCLGENNSLEGGIAHMEDLLLILEERNFYKEMELLICRIYFGIDITPGSQAITARSIHNFEPCNSPYEAFSTSTETSDVQVATTPSLVKAVCWLLLNISTVNVDIVISNINRTGLVRILLRTICSIPDLSENPKIAMLFMDILEMYSAVICLLAKCASLDEDCRIIALHTYGSINSLIGMMDYSYYDEQYPQVVFLRNRLWTQIFNFLTALVKDKEGYKTFISILNQVECKTFFDILCLAFKDKSSPELRKSALSIFTALLTQETHLKNIADSSNVGTLRNILDADGSNEDSIIANQICMILINLYEMTSLRQDCKQSYKNSVLFSLSSLLAISQQAKRCALKHGLLETIILQLKEFHIGLSIKGVDSIKKSADKKWISAILEDVDLLFVLLINFSFQNVNVKIAATESGLTDLIHKLWIWCSCIHGLQETALKLLCTITADCVLACQSLVLTSTVLGVGLRKTPTTLSLLHAIMNLILQDMDRLNNTNCTKLNFAFSIMKNSCHANECRNIISKSNFLNGFLKFQSPPTKKKKYWIDTCVLWLQFLLDFTSYVEGQLSLPKIPDSLDLLAQLTDNVNVVIRETALSVLRNISFHQFNRPRLLSSVGFLHLLKEKLKNGSLEEKSVVAVIIWSLIANNQKGKLIIKSYGIATHLYGAISHLNLSADNKFEESKQIMVYILKILDMEKHPKSRQVPVV